MVIAIEQREGLETALRPEKYQLLMELKLKIVSAFNYLSSTKRIDRSQEVNPPLQVENLSLKDVKGIIQDIIQIERKAQQDGRVGEVEKTNKLDDLLKALDLFLSTANTREKLILEGMFADKRIDERPLQIEVFPSKKSRHQPKHVVHDELQAATWGENAAPMRIAFAILGKIRDGVKAGAINFELTEKEYPNASKSAA
jgi:hypothetical protein